MDEVNDDIINNADADESRFHRMFSRILNLQFFLTKFGISSQVRSKLEIKNADKADINHNRKNPKNAN